MSVFLLGYRNPGIGLTISLFGKEGGEGGRGKGEGGGRAR